MGLDGYVACDCIAKGVAQVPAEIAGLVKDVQRLTEELKRRPRSDDPVTERFFERLDELVAASLSVGKPIGF